MKIQSLIKRQPFTVVELDGTTYEFKPDELGRQIADVVNRDHADMLLAIPEGYRALDEKAQAAAEKRLGEILDKAPEPEPVELLTSLTHPAMIDLGGDLTLSIMDVTDQAFARSGLTREQWNAQSDEQRAVATDALLDEIAPVEEEEDGGDDDQDGQQDGQAGEQDAPTEGNTNLGAPPQEDEGPKDDIPPADQRTDLPEADPKPLELMSRDELAAEYKARNGKAPHGKWTAEKILAELKGSDE